MARRAKVPIDGTHVPEAIKALGGSGTLLEVTRHIWFKYSSLVRPKDPKTHYGAFQILKDRLSAILSYRKSPFAGLNGMWEEK